MRPASRIYTVLCNNGSYRSGNLDELYLWLQQEYNISASRQLTCHRLRCNASRKNGYVPIDALLFPPDLSHKEAAAFLSRKKTQFKIPGIDHPVTGYAIWRDYVRAAGNQYPSEGTVTTRLKNGVTDLSELIAPIETKDNDAINEKKLRKKKMRMAREQAKRTNKEAAAAAKKKRQDSEINDEMISLQPLPPMQDWKGFDKHFYRRCPL